MSKVPVRDGARTTIYDVAKHIGMSSSTVSRVLADRGMVAEATRERVLSAAQELGYRTNAVARSLARKHSETIAILLPDITNPFFPSLVKALQSQAQRRGYTVILGSTEDDEQIEHRYLDTMLSHQVRHVLAVGLHVRRAQVEAYEKSGLTFIALDRAIPGARGFLVQSDNRDGARLATRHLIELGHRRIAHIAGPASVTVSKARRRGYLDAMEEAGLPVDGLIVESPFSEEGGAAAFSQLQDLGTGYSSIFAANDLIAIGALFAAHQRGLNVPDDFSLVGFDDVSLTRYTSPQLTTIRQDVAAMAEAGIDLVFADPAARRRRTVTLPVSLEIRQSTHRYAGDRSAER